MAQYKKFGMRRIDIVAQVQDSRKRAEQGTEAGEHPRLLKKVGGEEISLPHIPKNRAEINMLPVSRNAQTPCKTCHKVHELARPKACTQSETHDELMHDEFFACKEHAKYLGVLRSQTGLMANMR